MLKKSLKKSKETHQLDKQIDLFAQEEVTVQIGKEKLKKAQQYLKDNLPT